MCALTGYEIPEPSYYVRLPVIDSQSEIKLDSLIIFFN